MRNLRISTRLWIGFSCLTVLIAIVGLVSAAMISRMGARFDDVTDREYPKIVALRTIKENNESVARAIRDMLVHPEAVFVQKQFDILANSTKRG